MSETDRILAEILEELRKLAAELQALRAEMRRQISA